jgi:hypothetical protein
MTPMEEAIITCKYALNLGLTALNEHFNIWLDEAVNASGVLTQDEVAYIAALSDIKRKLGTNQCLLK